MNLNHPPTTDSLDSFRQQCREYLLGEWDDETAEAFERKLDNPARCEVLAEESQLLSVIGEALASEALTGGTAGEPATPSVPTANRPAVQLAHPPAQPRFSPRRFVALIASVAAVVTLAVLVGQNPADRSKPIASVDMPPVDGDAFELEVARALFDPSTDWVTEGGSADDVNSQVTGETAVGEEDQVLDEQSLQWLVVAVESMHASESNP